MIGDSFLVEFDSALDAVECAIEIQQFLNDYNLSTRDEWKIMLRIGIHLGDVVHKEGDILGDSVNVASRIEPLAPPQGVCITEQVYDHVRNKLPYQFSKLDSKELKNVKFQIDVYSVLLPWNEQTTNRVATPSLPANRIAVLPFQNISPDPADEYFADGMTEELIDRLAQINGLRVIARTSVMSYKKKDIRASEIGRELGIGSLVEGSVRKSGNKIRVNVQLIDANSDEHLWSSRYDKDLDDIFAVQSDIASRIVLALRESLKTATVPQTTEGATSSLTAYSYFLRGRQLFYQMTESSMREALALLEEATRLDPSFLRAYTIMGNCYIQLGIKSILTYDEAMCGAHSAAEKALSLNPDSAEVHALVSMIAWVEDDHALSGQEAKKAIELNPNLFDAHLRLAMVKATEGYPQEAIRFFKSARELDPLAPLAMRYLGTLYVYLGRDNEAKALWTENQIDPVELARIKIEFFLIHRDYVRAEEAIRFLEKLRPGDIYTISIRGFFSALTGDRKKAEETIITLNKQFRGTRIVNRQIGYIRYFLGDADAFFGAMSKAVEDHVLDPLIFRYSPLFEKARSDPRYRQILIKNGLDPELKE